jgi:hypothetical protein
LKSLISIFYSVILTFSLLTTAGCKKSPTEASDQSTIDTSSVHVRKPNIYLYPRTQCVLSVKLTFPLGGSIIQSVPSYLNGWNVEVDPSGKINQQYDFLFYECETPNVYQYDYGWLVSRDTLSSFFSGNLLKTGFNEREIADFLEYWMPRLTDHPFYIIYPQYADDIAKVIQLNISVPPENIQRLFYVIRGSDGNRARLITPAIPKFVRSGFVVTEWGVILK